MKPIRNEAKIESKAGPAATATSPPPTSPGHDESEAMRAYIKKIEAEDIARIEAEKKARDPRISPTSPPLSLR